jgi:hypothetical protein
MKTMKPIQMMKHLACALVAGILLSMFGGNPVKAQEAILPQTHLAIESIRLEGDEIVVNAIVSAGIKTVILETRPRVGAGNWEPRAVLRLGEFTTPVKVVTLRAPRSGEMELIQVRGETTESVPESFFKGASTDGLAVNGLGSSEFRAPIGAVDKVAAPEATAGGVSDTGTREVVESDIWQIEGDRLYFFNQYRGLQVVSLENPDLPQVIGTYEVPAAGEQMYLYDRDHVVLLARNNCGNFSSSAESQLVLLEVAGGQPTPVVEVPIEGNIRESRLVGTALYVVAERYRPVPSPLKPDGGEVREVWEWGSEVSSFDLGNFASPVRRFSEWIPGYGNAIMATDRYLFVATPQSTSQWWSSNSDVRVYDISAPDGTTRLVAKIPTAGRVKDKFKMHLRGDVFSVVTETSDRTLRTQVETFSLADPTNPTRSGALTIIERETLYATRFEGDRLYAVTFLRTDPLWVIDLSDPTQPRKMGELEIPGWSTYIQPLDGKLLTVGIDNTTGWRASVQLFDVRDPANPSLLSKILLGEEYSSTEANDDEKAFGFIPEENLILLPYTSYEGSQSFRGVHLIDLEADGLRARGSISHEFQARRATVYGDRIVSISGTELLTVDATDRDHPVTVSSVELSWDASRVFVNGGHVVTVSDSYGDHPALRVVSAADPSTALKTLRIAELPILGAVQKDQKLFVLQGKSTEVLWPRVWTETDYAPIATNQAVLRFSVFDVSSLPEVTLIGETEREFEKESYWNQFAPVWVKPDTLVWHSRNGGLYRDVIMNAAGGAEAKKGFAPDERISILPWWGSFDSRFFAYDVSGASPRFLSEVSLRGEENWWDFSPAFAANGLVYVSHQTSEYLPDVRPPATTVYKWDGTKSVPVTEVPPPGVWVQRFFLDVINFNNPVEPTVRKPLNIPGALIGLSHAGQVLYTQGYRYGNVDAWSDWSEWLDAISYDGVETRLVDSMPLPESWPHPVLVDQQTVLLGRPSVSKAESPTAEVWTVTDGGKFSAIGRVDLSTPVNEFKAIGDMVGFRVDSGLDVYDLSNPAAPVRRGSGSPMGCMWYNWDYADGALDSGLWLPLGPYGLGKIEIKPQ